MVVVPAWAVPAACFAGVITCDSRPGALPPKKPQVISWDSPFLHHSNPAPAPGPPAPGGPAGGAPPPPAKQTSTAKTTVPAPTVSLHSTGTTVVPSVTSSTSSTFSWKSTLSAPASSLTTMSTSVMSSIAAPSASASASASAAATALSHVTVANNILVIARDSTSATNAASGLNGYGIPYTTLVVPQTGTQLPALNSSNTGNFGGIVIASEVSYDYGADGWQSALTMDQWNQLYAYQLAYGVRMVQFDVFPGPLYGASAIAGGCCNPGVEQDISFTDTSDFPTAGLRTGAGVSTEGLWHYPATISNTTSTKQIAAFAANSVVSTDSTAAVINNFDGPCLDYLDHPGVYAGYRRVNLNTQIDDMFLETEMYYPAGSNFRIRAEDLSGIRDWSKTVNARLNPGSIYFPETGHNGNGNIENSSNTDAGYTACNGGGIEYDSPPDTPLEYQKPLGTGTDLWPKKTTSYQWTTACTRLDPLLQWWSVPENLNSIASLSHTFTHEEQNNATFSDVTREISFNQAWLKQNGFDKAAHYTDNGIIPPAITGLHNGDALRAWWENGITNCVGDNTRPVLMNPENSMWPLFTTVADNGFAGMQVNPRWATRIYYNCDLPQCTVQEWIDTSSGSGTFADLLAVEKADTMRHLFGLHHDPYMFHQANLRNVDVDPITINGVSSKFSIFQAWVETQIQEFIRLVEWPLVSLKHADMSASFLARYNRDACGYSMSYTTANGKITAVTVSAKGNTCSEAIPVTFPTAPSNTQGFTVEQLGSDPATVWVKLSGSPVTFTLSSPIPL
ncbi:hypothetical protein N7539_009208 [Penicillium diatomitis]|uniref:Extracellular serine-rich protein n=1 Tax=Penicillium diatomitis TaxID=2819901 RepID=A0A9W9WL91_9EURO|nr:uncharacterized protein N7539_009208 [Penicillium diatomitis]KAJ5469590.1 hypothetical protein N7539_009208 [Penicillium diatomitis]